MSIYDKMAGAHPSLARGIVWCTVCGRSQRVVAAERLQAGWPKCHGYTMTIDSPAERASPKPAQTTPPTTGDQSREDPK